MTGKNLGFKLYKEWKGEDEFNKKMEENNKVSQPSLVIFQIFVYFKKHYSAFKFCDDNPF